MPRLRAGILTLLVATLAVPAAARQSTTKETLAPTNRATTAAACTAALSPGDAPAGKSTITPDARNTLCFDHYSQAGSTGGPYVLAVKDGGYFQVVFVRTDPRKFNYTVTASTDEQQKVGSQQVSKDRVATDSLDRFARVAMRHSRLFTRYRVAISLRDDLRATTPRAAEPGGTEKGGTGFRPAPGDRPPAEYVLYDTQFDLWVETLPDYELTFSGGLAFNGLRSHEYFIKTDDKGTEAATDDVKTVEEDTDARAAFRPDIIALANIRHPDWRGLGLSFGVGLNNDADPRYFLGGSYIVGGKFIFSAGWAGGKVNELPTGQELGKPPINGDNTLSTPVGRFRNAFYVGLGFTFINRESEFTGAFAAAQTTKKAPEPEEAPEGPGETPASKGETPNPANLTGTYTLEGEPPITVTFVDRALKLAVGTSNPEELTNAGGPSYRVGTAKDAAVKFRLDSEGKAVALEHKGKVFQKAK